MTDRRLDRGALVWGALFTLVGLAYLGQELGAWHVRGEVFVPLLLVFAGAVLLLSTVIGREVGDDATPERQGDGPTEASDDDVAGRGGEQGG